jgi:His/Glu/Gln/Arg/opine family amino acid ABC transporter permease subunit
MHYRPDLSVITDHWTVILAGLRLTILVAVMSMACALLIGLLVALIRISPFRPLGWLANLYVQFFRGIPQFVFLLWLYYGLAMLLGINFTALQAGVIALSVQYGAYLSEIFRAGIQAIHKGQREAGLSVGLSRLRIYQRIILPQAFRIVLPPTVNMWISMLKDTALVSVIGVDELMRTTELQSNFYFRPFEFYTTAALLYVAMTFFFSRLASTVERRLRF